MLFCHPLSRLVYFDAFDLPIHTYEIIWVVCDIWVAVVVPRAIRTKVVRPSSPVPDSHATEVGVQDEFPIATWVSISQDRPPAMRRWDRVAQHGYAKASDDTPSTSSLYNHLAILASMPIINLTATRHKSILPKILLRTSPYVSSAFGRAAPRNSITQDSVCMFMSKE